jgi:5-oxoprolinase (ATP-hydrolysing)
MIGDGAKHAREDFSVADPIKLSIFGHRFMGIAEQMGRALQRTSCAPAPARMPAECHCPSPRRLATPPH